MPAGTDGKRHHQAAQRSAAKTCQAPDPVEPGYDTPVKQGLHADGLCIGGDIQQIPGRPKAKEP